mmetsp:Transcript_8183/g.6100  ORF Transcript_8183/g.6100 Transcript_8183/m.6100 type:complete len:173 (+) Transcript_8183:1273-1791(+)
MERARTREPMLSRRLFDLFQDDLKETSAASFFLNPKGYKNLAEHETKMFRDYMVTESLQQYKDYYESDAEERGFFEFMGTGMSNRDKIRFTELFEDFTAQREDMKDYMMILKREHNPELSLFSNFLLDLQDFKDRVRPLAKDLALTDAVRDYQKLPMEEIDEHEKDLREYLE